MERRTEKISYPLPPGHRNGPRSTLRGAVIPEYIVVLALFIGLAVVLTISIRELSTGFHNDMTGGFDQAYPTNFVPPPTPAPSPTP